MAKKLIAALLFVASTPLLAQEIVSYTNARVVAIDPITSTAYATVPRTSCTVIEERTSPPAPAVPGAIVKDGETKRREQCSTYQDREAFVKIIGYNVTFEYAGQLRTTKMARDPGNYVNIKTVTRIFAIE